GGIGIERSVVVIVANRGHNLLSRFRIDWPGGCEGYLRAGNHRYKFLPRPLQLRGQVADDLGDVGLAVSGDRDYLVHGRRRSRDDGAARVGTEVAKSDPPGVVLRD